MRDLFDDRAGLTHSERVIRRSGFQKFDRTGSFVEIDIRCQHPFLEIDRNRIEVVGWRKRPTGPAES
jgi:hypothetical protein